MSQMGQILSGAFGGAIKTLTGNAGGAVSPDGIGNITVVGSGAITVTGNPGTNTLTITTSAGFAWVEVTGVSDTMVIDTGYIANNAGVVTLTLPATAALGSIIRVTGKGAGGWLIAQNAGQTIYFGASTTTPGVGGSLASTAQRDTVELVCVTADDDWNVLSSVGNITVV